MTEHSTDLVTQKPRDRGLQITGSAGGVAFGNMTQIIEFSQLMAKAEVAIPKFLRLNIGACIAVTMQAVEWEMTPFQVANKSYSVNDRLAFESQLMHAVILKRAPIKGRLKVEYIGEGPTRQCRVWVYLRDDVAAEAGEIVDYTSPMFKDIKTKNSPLWTADPDQQFFYYSSRALCRRHFPDVLLGVYSRDEMLEAEPFATVADQRKEAGNRLAARLAESAAADAETGATTEGFAPGVVEKGLAGEVVDPETGEITEAEETYSDILLGKARGKSLEGRRVFDPWFNALAEHEVEILKPHMPSLMQAANLSKSGDGAKAAKIIEHDTEASEGAKTIEAYDERVPFGEPDDPRASAVELAEAAMIASGAPQDLPADNGEREALRFDFAAELADFIKMLGTFETTADLDSFANELQRDPASWFSAAPQAIKDQAADAFTDALDALKRRIKAADAAEAKATAAAAKVAAKAAEPAQAPAQAPVATVKAEPAADPELEELTRIGNEKASMGVRALKAWSGPKMHQNTFNKIQHLMAGWTKIAKAADEAL